MAIEFREQTLDNGLTVLAEINDEGHTSAVGFFVKTGTRDEPEEVMGVSHFLEHMMFKGTARRSADDVNREFDEIGANYNAFTSQEMTVYFAQVLPEYMPRAVDLLGDMLRPSLREDDFNMEKNVILEEIGMYEDRPQWRLHDTMLEKHFAGHPLSYRVLGTAESIKALSAEQMRSYFAEHYSADNITVAAAGKIDWEALLQDVERIAGHWQPTKTQRDYGEVPRSAADESFTDAKLNRHYLALIFPGPSAQDDDRYAAQVYSHVLGDVDGSRLYWSLIDPGLADEADLTFYPQDQTGSFVGYASATPDVAAEVEQVFRQSMGSYLDDIDEEEIIRAKNKIATQATVRGENPLGRMRGLGGQWTYQRQYTPLEEEIQRIMAVTSDDIRALLERYPLEPCTTVRLGPGEKPKAEA